MHQQAKRTYRPASRLPVCTASQGIQQLPLTRTFTLCCSLHLKLILWLGAAVGCLCLLQQAAAATAHACTSAQGCISAQPPRAQQAALRRLPCCTRACCRCRCLSCCRICCRRICGRRICGCRIAAVGCCRAGAGSTLRCGSASGLSDRWVLDRRSIHSRQLPGGRRLLGPVLKYNRSR